MRAPAEVYQPSPRKFPTRAPEPEYPPSMLVRTVRHRGHFHWKKHDVFLTEVLWGESIGLLREGRPLVHHLLRARPAGALRQ